MYKHTTIVNTNTTTARQSGHVVLLFVCVCLLLLLAGCGTDTAAQQDDPPTPTPLPPAPVLERPTYVVERGTIERTIEPNGRVTPVDLVQLSFRRNGRVEVVHVQRDDQVREGDILAELIQDDERDELREAEDGLVQAQRDLESARMQKEKDIRRAENNLEDAQHALEEARQDREDAIADAEADLQDAHRELGRLLPGGTDDLYREAQQNLEDAYRTMQEQQDDLSLAKTNAENALVEASEALIAAQDEYSDAYWDWKWVQEHGTNPDAVEEVDPQTGAVKTDHKDLTDEEKREYERAFRQAEEALRAAEREVEIKKHALEIAREDEAYGVPDTAQDVEEAQRELDSIVTGENEELIAAQRSVEERQQALEEARAQDLYNEETAVENALLELEEARDETFNTEMENVDDAQRRLEKARKQVQDGQIIAPQDGSVLAINVAEGDTIEAFDPVFEIADPSNLEIAAELSSEQMRQLAEGQPAEVSLLTRPDVVMPAVIRRMPAPYGSGGSGVVQEQDKTTRFEILDTKGQTLNPGSVANIRIVLERKEGVLMLPPEAIRSFEGRTFVVVREDGRERRVSVKVGIETEDTIEIVEGLNAGDTVVGQ